MVRYRKFFNKVLWSRFAARQIDLLIVQLTSFGIFSYLAKNYAVNPLIVFMITLFTYHLLEGLLLYYIKTTVGKFFLGLRVYPKSLKISLLRSLKVYWAGLGLGIPVFGWMMMLIQYFKAVNQPPAWDKDSPLVQTHQNLNKGLIAFLIMNCLVILLYSSLPMPEVKKNIPPIETVVIEYEGYEGGPQTTQQILWQKACMYGALSFAQTQNEQLDTGVVTFACKEGAKKLMQEGDEPEVIYIKACGFGLGIGTQLIWDEQAVENMQEEAGELLKKVCIPNIDF